jgi:hypothetical protein
MRSFVRRLLIAASLCVTFLLVLSSPAEGFGKNKVTYTRFDWKVHTTAHFEFYYYLDEPELMLEIITWFETAYARMSADLGTDLTGRIPVILYTTYSDFQQTNVLAGFIPTGVGGFSELLKRRIVIPLQGSKSDLESLINHELVHSFQFEIFFQNRLSRIAPVPMWIMEGMAEHLAADWDAYGRMVLRDAVINGNVPGLESLYTFNYLRNQYIGYKISQSAVDYIRKEFGMQKFREFLWEVRKTLRTREYVETAMKEIYELSLQEMSARWHDDLRRRVIEIERRRESISIFDSTVPVGRTEHRRLAPVYGIGNEVIHFLEAGRDGLHIYTGAVRESERDPLNLCLTCSLNGRKYRQIVTQGRPLSLNLNDGMLAYINKYENTHSIKILDPASSRLVTSYQLHEDSPASPAFSPDGRHIAYSAWSGLQSDIFVLDRETGTSRNLTRDPYVNRTPFWSPDGKYIVYSSERNGQFDLILLDVDSETTRVLVADPGDQITPAWSPDGKKIVYVSDQTDGVLDPHVLDMETMQSRKIAAPVTGCLLPSFSIDSEKVVMLYFLRGRERIIVVPADRKPVIPEVAAEAQPVGVDGEAYYSELSEAFTRVSVPQSVADIQADPVKFRLIPDYAVGMLSYGTSGDFFVEGGVVLSDILGDHRVEIIGRRRDNRSGLLAQYMYLRNRINYGALFMQDSNYYYLYNSQLGAYQRVAWDEYWGMFAINYPFSTYYRAELNVGYQHLEYESPISDFTNLNRRYAYIEPAIAGDTIQYKLMAGYPEIYRGWRFRLSTRIPVEAGDKFENYWNSRFDFREYFPLTDRSVIAARQWGIFSEGSQPQFYGVGGPGTVRGYGFRQMVGNRIVMTSTELRFPLLDHLIFPGGISFHGFRGKFFVDVAAVWTDDESFEWTFSNPEAPVRDGSLVASYGWGINFWMIGVEWHFEWARRTDFKSTSGDWHYEWSIRRSF